MHQSLFGARVMDQHFWEGREGGDNNIQEPSDPALTRWCLRYATCSIILRRLDDWQWSVGPLFI